MRILFLFFIITLAGCVSHHAPVQQPYVPSSISAIQMHVVARGDTLWSIGRTYGISLEALRRSNNFSPGVELRVGQNIRIPGSGIQALGSGVFRWPLRGVIVGTFGSSSGNLKNKGLNVKVGSLEVVKASAAGKVIFVDHIKGWGQTIVLEHPANFYTVYAGVQDISIADGARVDQGQSLARVACGQDGTYVLHFEVRRAHNPLDPLRYLK
ncbi:MAG: peptidoglycan DD-metalloendopeptidase family protein [Candidatus Omnitrophota bacterium]